METDYWPQPVNQSADSSSHSSREEGRRRKGRRDDASEWGWANAGRQAGRLLFHAFAPPHSTRTTCLCTYRLHSTLLTDGNKGMAWLSCNIIKRDTTMQMQMPHSMGSQSILFFCFQLIHHLLYTLLNLEIYGRLGRIICFLRFAHCTFKCLLLWPRYTKLVQWKIRRKRTLTNV